jgi:rsbT co-antagonist protein RsbR
MVLVKAYSVVPINLDINSIILLIILGAVSQLGAYNVRTSFSAAEAARRSAAEAAGRFEQLNIELEDKVDARTSELHAAFRTAEAQVSERQALLDEIASQQVVIREMSVPVLPVSAHILVMPLVGVLDSSRLAEIQSQALSAIEQSGAHTLLIDLTGVPIVDTQVAQGLLRTVQAARLLGTNPVLIGIRPEVAQSIVSLGIDLSEVQTKASLASALRIGGG